MNDTKPVKTVKKEDCRFKPGVSGNPLGRPKGSKNKTTVIKEAIEANLVEAVEKDVMEIFQTAVNLAKDGNEAMIKLVMDRVWPVARAVKDDKGIDRSKVVINVSMLPNPEGSESRSEETSGITLEATPISETKDA